VVKAKEVEIPHCNVKEQRGNGCNGKFKRQFIRQCEK
jgi:hypothetical protein